jgi:hypothetical protein
MRRRHALPIVVALLSSTSCDDRAPAPRAGSPPRTKSASARSCEATGVRDVVRLLGERMQRVSLLAPDSVVARELREAYSPLVTPGLLDAWVADPASAPGRKVSSPWPERIEIQSIDDTDAGACRVEGEVIYATSTDSAQGGEHPREPVTLSVRLDHGAWRVSTYEAAPPLTGPRR